ncbi:hypothetical protein [Marinomonas algicola]|uniref:hypothetical protein n=1 Tax=Marinomonas algicola TaxID=2773454 RepID=UPI00174D9CA7|nr:hypothetical protein [Marinomonas algicola]
MKKILMISIMTLMYTSPSFAESSESCTKKINIMMSAFELAAEYRKAKGEALIEQITSYRKSHTECETLALMKNIVGG